MQLHLLHNTPNAYFEIFYLFWCWKTKSKFSASRNITQSSQDFFRMRYLVTTLVHSFEFMETQCGKTRNLLWHILNKNFVKASFSTFRYKLRNKRVDFTKYFSMRWKWISHSVEKREIHCHAKFFSSNQLIVKFFSNKLISRNFCDKMVAVKFRNFHTVHHSLFLAKLSWK